jgi:hypothetical protein
MAHGVHRLAHLAPDQLRAHTEVRPRRAVAPGPGPEVAVQPAVQPARELIAQEVLECEASVQHGRDQVLGDFLVLDRLLEILDGCHQRELAEDLASVVGERFLIFVRARRISVRGPQVHRTRGCRSSRNL